MSEIQQGKKIIMKKVNYACPNCELSVTDTHNQPSFARVHPARDNITPMKCAITININIHRVIMH